MMLSRFDLGLCAAFITAAALVSAPAWSAPLGPTQAELDGSASATDTWLMTNKSYDGLRYVALDQITPKNVAELKPVCTYDSGLKAQAQSTPLLYDGILYATAAQTTLAIDAKSCKEVWRYEWVVKGKALSTVNRGVAMKDGLIVRGTADGFLIALSMTDGKLAWQRQITSIEESHYLSMPPMIVDDRVIYGTAGADWGGQGWIGAFKLTDGTEIWRYEVLPPKDAPGANSWGSADAIAHGGGSFWTPISLDRAKGIVFIPSGNPAPDFYGESRPGADLGTDTVIALDAKTGKPLWSRQLLAHDTHDWDLSQTSPLVHATVKGQPRDIVIAGGKDGRLRALDRETSEVLYDLAISKQENVDADASVTPTHICPGLLGGQEWSSSAYDPNHGTVIAPMVNWCGTVVHDAAPPVHQVATHFYGGKIDQDPIDQARGVLAAIDVASGKPRWTVDAAAPMLANVTVTKGGVVFAGDLKGTLYAVNADTGVVLLRYALPASAGGGIFSYQLGGKQYLTALSGSVSAFFGGGTETVKITVLALP